jgi:putative ABC transport system substrate-binding protein
MPPIAAERAHRVTAMRRGLGKMGFVGGRNAATDYRWAAGQSDRGAGDGGRSPHPQCRGHHRAAANLTRAAMAATQTIPIVFATAGNPVQLG